MSQIWNLDCSDDGDCDIRVYIPGPPGPPNNLIDVGTRAAPVLITGSIAAPVNPRQRSFIKGNAGPVVDPTIPNPAVINAPYELYLFATDDTNSVTMNGSSNLQLSGQWIGTNGSMLYLQWDKVSKYVEAGRNEI